MFTKKTKNESIFDWCKKNWKDIALVSLGAIVGVQLLIGLYYGVAFLFFILNGPIGYSVAGAGAQVISHFSTMALVGLGVIGAGIAATAASLFKWFHRPRSPVQPSVAVPNTHPEKYEVELVSTHAQVNEHLNTLAQQASQRQNNAIDDLKVNLSSNQETVRSDQNFLAKVKQFFHKLPLLFSRTKNDQPVQTIPIENSNSIRLNK